MAPSNLAHQYSSRRVLDEMRPGFKAMLERIAGDGIRCIIVESPDRFARDLTVQLTGHDFLKSLGVALIPATSPDHARRTRAGIGGMRCSPLVAY